MHIQILTYHPFTQALQPFLACLKSKQTIFALLLLGNLREQLLGPDPELILTHVATLISNKRQYSCRKEELVKAKTQIMRFKADRETAGGIGKQHIQKLQETHRFKEAAPSV